MQVKFSFQDAIDTKIAYLLLLLLLLPTCLYISNVPVWDDQLILNSHAHWSVQSLLGSYAINNADYWRPLAVISIAIPSIIGLPIWVNKLISLALFFLQGCLTVAIVDNRLQNNPANHKSLFVIITAVLIALHPVFVEATIWISARADLLMSIFVQLGIVWILNQQDRQKKKGPCHSNLTGLVSAFFLTWLICASKDTGVMWAGMGLGVLVCLGFESNVRWRKYWQYCSSGLFSAIGSYLFIRHFVLGAGSRWSELRALEPQTFIDRIGLFEEVVIRSFVNIFLPIADPIPYKASGWFNGGTVSMIIFIAIAVFFVVGIFLRWLFSNSMTAGWLTTCSLVSIAAIATIEAFLEPQHGTVISTRYLTLNASLIFISLAIIQNDNSIKTSTGNQIHKPNGPGLPITVILGLIIFQSMLLWSSSRAAWTSDMNLWEAAWNQGARDYTTTLNYSNELSYRGQPAKSQELAEDWINRHRTAQDEIGLCQFYDLALKGSLTRKDEANATRIARQAVSTGWCKTDLAQNIASVMIVNDCKLVLPMLERTLEEGAKPAGSGYWKYDSQETKKRLLLMGAYAEARCGKAEYAQNLLKATAKIDKKWEPGGKEAAELLESARSGT